MPFTASPTTLMGKAESSAIRKRPQTLAYHGVIVHDDTRIFPGSRANFVHAIFPPKKEMSVKFLSDVLSLPVSFRMKNVKWGIGSDRAFSSPQRPIPHALRKARKSYLPTIIVQVQLTYAGGNP